MASPSPAPPSPACELRPTASSGLSLFAARPLAAGAVVLSDAPLFLLPQTSHDPAELYALVRALQPDQLRTYLGLANAKGKERDVSPLMGIFKTNVLPAGPNESGIFPLASRLNHSCLPTAEPTFASSRLTVRALAPLDPSAEITISYLGPRLLLPAADRQAWLFKSFGFLCECDACTVDFAASDELRARSAALKQTIDESFAADPEKAFRASTELLRTTTAAGLAVERAFARATLCQLLILWGAGGSALAEEHVEKTVGEMKAARGEGDEWRRWAPWVGRTKDHPRNGVVGSFDFGRVRLDEGEAGETPVAEEDAQAAGP